MKKTVINVSNRRECFFDDYLIDKRKTTANFLVHKPQKQGVVLSHTEPWEGNGSNYHNFFYDNGVFRMYYLGWQMLSGRSCNVCYAESKDGVNWVKPNLNLCEYEGSTQNNIVIKGDDVYVDNCFVFRDDNPNCPKEKKYKAIMQQGAIDGKHTLWYFYSHDGLSFTKGEMISNQGAFDSVNVAFWDNDAKIYRCYYRSAHTIGKQDSVAPFTEEHIRDIRYIYSKDFKTWSKPVMLDFGGGEDFSLYTNAVQKYYRAPHLLVGFPTRYFYRRDWTPTYDELCGAENRGQRCKVNMRYGLALTDALFMCSRNGKKFKRYNQAILTPGVENGKNWVYGDGYFAVGMIETPSKFSGEPGEISVYAKQNHWTGPSELVRYTFRLDGFVSLHADGKQKVIVTKPFIYDGNALKINFETSAFGRLQFSIIDENENEHLSYETFGNSVDRKVRFENDEIISKLKGKPVTLKIKILDGDLYSIKFED